MLAFHDRSGASREPDDLRNAALSSEIVWIDLLKPTPEETSFVERATGLHVPTAAELSEIESSSRMRTNDRVLFLSAPLVSRATDMDPQTTPVGFVLCPERLITVRFEPLGGFTAVDQAPLPLVAIPAPGPVTAP